MGRPELRGTGHVESDLWEMKLKTCRQRRNECRDGGQGFVVVCSAKVAKLCDAAVYVAVGHPVLRNEALAADLCRYNLLCSKCRRLFQCKRLWGIVGYKPGHAQMQPHEPAAINGTVSVQLRRKREDGGLVSIAGPADWSN
jgi:hypothetical protein